jgi:ERCC4-type nuclease
VVIKNDRSGKAEIKKILFKNQRPSSLSQLVVADFAIVRNRFAPPIFRKE